ncbi:MAG: nucleotide-binding protein [Peptococcaceae bacterium BRH_c4b]|nr:MAG: nucleotide-binding protein [Peptococcaceae bacterium BRH_c4b]
MSKVWGYASPGIPDGNFIRGKVPMTREEIRVVTLAKARLDPGMIIWDVGSGTGSISVEAARLASGGRVFAVERSPEGLELTRKNAEHFGLDNITVVAGEAPGALGSLPSPHRVFVGGSGGNLSAVIDIVETKLLPGGRLVINAVSLETLAGAVERLKTPWQTDIIQISAARAERVGKSHIMRGLNPVYIITAWKEEEGDDR